MIRLEIERFLSRQMASNGGVLREKHFRCCHLRSGSKPKNRFGGRLAALRKER